MSSKTDITEFSFIAENVSEQVTEALKKLHDPKTRLDMKTLIELKAAEAAFTTLVNSWSSVYNNFLRRGMRNIE